MTHRELSIGLFVDSMLSQLPPETTRRDYVAKTITLFVTARRRSKLRALGFIFKDTIKL